MPRITAQATAGCSRSRKQKTRSDCLKPEIGKLDVAGTYSDFRTPF